MPIITTIDVGVIHLGICVANVADDFSSKEIWWVDVVDITCFRHRDSLRSDCTLHHTRNFADWIDHFILDHQQFFDASDLILIEKQPPQGFVVVEQLLFSRFREKTQLINPRHVHRYLNMNHLDYEQRKVWSVKIASRELPEHLLEQSGFYDRQHDIGDAVCMLLYYVHKKQEDYRRKLRYDNLTRDTSGLNVIERLELFRFI